MIKTVRKELSFTIKISMLFILLGLGYYSQHNNSDITLIIKKSITDFKINNDFIVSN